MGENEPAWKRSVPEGMRKGILLLAILAACAGPKPAPEPAPAPKAEPAPAAATPAPPPEEPPHATEPKPKPTLGKYDPPATLGHLETTPPEQREEIDDLIAVMLDVEAGRDSLDARAKLAAIGKPAFLPILGKMAQVRDTITDDDSIEERLVESSLMLADQCLREMDGYLDAHDKAWIRPGAERKYITYILRLHYRRWVEGMGSASLKDMHEMPGPFDPSKVPPGGD